MTRFQISFPCYQEIGKPKNSLEEMVEENFLVDPSVVGKRKTSRVQVKICYIRMFLRILDKKL